MRVTLTLTAWSIAFVSASFVHGEDTSGQRIEVSDLKELDFPPGGTLHMTNANGEITIEGWDQPGMEITVIKTTKNVLDLKSKDAAKDKGIDTKAGTGPGRPPNSADNPSETAAPGSVVPANIKRELDAMKIATERKGDEVLVSTTYPKHEFFARPFFGQAYVDVEYRIKIPRAARVNIDQYSGETHIENISGELRVTDKRGEITVREPPDGQYEIHARSVFGDVTSDFAGDEQRKKLVGRAYALKSSSTTPQKMFLHIGYGDILILKIH